MKKQKTIIVCEECGKKVEKLKGHVDWSIRRGMKLFCNRRCSGKFHRVKQLEVTETERECSLCSELKPIEKFELYKSKITGLVLGRRNICNDCRRKAAKRYNISSSTIIRIRSKKAWVETTEYL